MIHPAIAVVVKNPGHRPLTPAGILLFGSPLTITVDACLAAGCERWESEEITQRNSTSARLQPRK
jgi:hypothetical protein